MSLRSLLVLLHDIAAAALAWWLAYLLRFNFYTPPEYQAAMLQIQGLLLPLAGLTFWSFGLYRGMWRFSSLPDLKRIILAAGCASVIITIAIVMTGHRGGVPRSTLILWPLLVILLMGGSRFIYRSAKDGHLLNFGELSQEPILVLGAGAAAALLLRDLTAQSPWRVVGLLDDDLAKQGRQLHGVRVIGPLSEVVRQAQSHDVSRVIIAMPSASAEARRRAMELAIGAGLTVMTVPGFNDLISGRIAISQIRKVELDDLLGRDPVHLDTAVLNDLIGGRTVMITGAGGSIGSELCRQIAAFKPGLMVFYEANEFAMYHIEQEFQRKFPEQKAVYAMGDVKHSARLNEVMAAHRPTLVFHAAAYKHVPMMECVNAWQAVRNNVAGTLTVARAAIEHGVDKFILISTDKAVNPTNVMGATKRLAEMVCQALNGSSATCFEMVRFGNVLGSSGSVIPKFREQIAQGGPITVTHPEIIRFFMSIPEAAQLVLQAGAMGRGGEIFVLDMGEPVKIVDLARDIIRLSGFSEDEIRIEFTGLRPGEKLFEELLADGETTRPTPHPKLRVAQARQVDAVWLEQLQPWLSQECVTDEQTRRDLQRWVPEYQPARHSS